MYKNLKLWKVTKPIRKLSQSPSIACQGQIHVSVVTPPINMIQNGDFRDGLTGWYIPAQGFISLDSTQGHIAPPCLKDSPTSYIDRSTWPINRTPIKTDGTQRVYARAWIKTDPSTDTYGGGRIGTDFRQGETMTKALASLWVPWGNNWTLAEVLTPYPVDSNTVLIWLQAMLHDNIGTAYFADVELYVLEPGQQPPPT